MLKRQKCKVVSATDDEEEEAPFILKPDYDLIVIDDEEEDDMFRNKKEEKEPDNVLYVAMEEDDENVLYVPIEGVELKEKTCEPISVKEKPQTKYRDSHKPQNRKQQQTKYGDIGIPSAEKQMDAWKKEKRKELESIWKEQGERKPKDGGQQIVVKECRFESGILHSSHAKSIYQFDSYKFLHVIAANKLWS